MPDPTTSIWSAALTLFLVMDPLGNVPAWVAILEGVEPARRRWVILRENLIALAVLVLFFFAGPSLLALLGVEGAALRLAGGVIIFLIALRLIFPRRGGIFGDDTGDGEPLVVPLAIPLLAGPSALAAVMVLTTAETDRLLEGLASIGLAWAASLAILMLAPLFQRILGRRGLIACERLMGMILILVAVQMLIDGIDAHFFAGT